MGPSNPFIGYLAAGSLLIGLSAGWKIKDWQCDAAYAKALEKAEKQRKEMQGKIDALSISYEEERDKANVVVAKRVRTIREVYAQVPPVSADCVPDARVLGMLESSISEANASATGKSGK